MALQYAKYKEGYTQPIRAKGRIAFTVNPSNAQTVTVGSVVYAFKTTPAAAGDVQIGTDLETSLANLLSAMQGTAVAGAYYAGTKSTLLATAELGTQTIYLTAVIPGTAGNSVSIATNVTGATASGSTLAGAFKGGLAQAPAARIVIAVVPTAADTIIVGAVTYTAAAGDNTGLNVDITANNTPAKFAAALAAKIAGNAAVDATTIVTLGGTIMFRHATAGSTGNAAVLTSSSAGATVQVTGSGTFLGGQNAITFRNSALSWKKLPARNTSYGSTDLADILPQEIGAGLTPKGAYKSGVVAGGAATILPRLEGDLGIMLLALMGECVTTDNGDGSFTHVFRFNSSYQGEVPWLAVRKMIPGRQVGQDVAAVGEMAYDNIISALRLTVPQTGPAEMQTSFIGRYPLQDNHPEGWVSTAYENAETVPISCNGSFQIPSLQAENLPVTQVIADMSNGTTGPREEFVIGSHFLDDIVNRNRAMSISFMHKWDSPELEQHLFGNASGATQWSSTVYQTKTGSAGDAFILKVESPKVIPTTTRKFSLVIAANNVAWQRGGGIALEAGGIIMQQVVGTVLTPDSGSYCEFRLTNAVASYAIPTEP